jgi:hypothetical protein
MSRELDKSFVYVIFPSGGGDEDRNGADQYDGRRYLR